MATRHINRLIARTAQKLLIGTTERIPTVVNFLAHDTGEPVVTPASGTDMATLSRVVVVVLFGTTVSTSTCGTNLINGFVARAATGVAIGTRDNFARFPMTIQGEHFVTIVTSGVLVTETPCADIAPILDVDHTVAGALTAATPDTHDGLGRVGHLRRGLIVEP
jgi:hypothetical protein